MRNPKYHIYLMPDERRMVINSLIDLRNNLILQGKCVSRSENRSCTGFEPHSRRLPNRTCAAHLTAHGLPDIISTAHIV